MYPDIFNRNHLYAMPNQNQSLFHLFISSNEYQYPNEEWKNLWPSYLCTKNRVKPLRKNPDCVTFLLSIEEPLEKIKLESRRSKWDLYITIFPVIALTRYFIFKSRKFRWTKLVTRKKTRVQWNSSSSTLKPPLEVEELCEMK